MDVLIVGLVLAWIAILLLGLAVGGLLAQVRELSTTGHPIPRGSSSSIRVSWLRDSSNAEIRTPYAAVFGSDACSTCKTVVPRILSQLYKPSLLPFYVVMDSASKNWGPLPSGVERVVDQEALERFHIPATPWFISVDEAGRAVASFPIGSESDVKRSVELVLKSSP